ncbi:MAG TPA: ABC transporter ATP-binding protein [Actinomycetota bacterium]|nr:ABC transporter ATP-binding protein [Actinomycetota bacterium]
MDGTAIEIRGLRKSYEDVEAVKGVDLSVPEGEVFALLGPNGAGKTTIVEIMEGFRDRSAGEVSVLGFDPARHDRGLRSQVGIVLQSTGIDPFLNVGETVDMYRAYYPSPRPVDEILAVVGLTEKRDTRVLKLSGGQQRRLDVAIALAGDPRLLFLDEPTTGFDPSARRNAWEVVKNLASLGKTIFLTTHYMDEAQYLANEVAVIAGGVIVAQGPPSSLGGRDTAASRITFRLPAGAPELPDSMRPETPGAGGVIELTAQDPTRLLHDLTGWALERGVALEGLGVARPTLEDVYLEITGGEAGTEGEP